MNARRNVRGARLPLALLLAAASVTLLLAPLSWVQARRAGRAGAIEAAFKPSPGQRVTSSGYRRELARRLVHAGANPLPGLVIALAHLGVIVVVLLALQGRADFAGRRFAWIANLARPDGLLRLSAAGGPLHVLPGVLAISVWAFWWLARPQRAAAPRGSRATALVVAVAVCVLTWRWPAGMHLFAIGLLWFGALQARLLRAAGRMGRKTPQ